jgi:hypothetical protein
MFPKKCGQLAETEEQKRALMLEPFTPLKIRQSVLEDLKPILAELLSDKNEVRNISEGERACNTPRGPKLDLVTPEEEVITFQNKNDPPMNALIKDLDKLNVRDGSLGGEAIPIVANPGPSAATKDDKAPISHHG